MDGDYRDDDFLRKVSHDVHAFLQQNPSQKVKSNRVLLFPPYLSSRHRFLIHKYVQEHCVAKEGSEGDLHTFSVGQDDQRRIVVCSRDILKKTNQQKFPADQIDDDGLMEGSPSAVENPDSVLMEKLSSAAPKELPSNASRTRSRRPDKQLYVPKAKRSDHPDRPSEVDSIDIITCCTSTPPGDLQLKKEITAKSDETTETRPRRSNDERANKEASIIDSSNGFQSTKSSDDESGRESAENLHVDLIKSTSSVESLDESCLEANSAAVEKEASTAKLTKGKSDQIDSSRPHREKPDIPVPKELSRSSNDDWDALYDDSGDCLDSSSLQQLTEAVGKVSIQTPEIDYWSTIESETKLSDDAFGHVIEIYDFPVEFNTQDLFVAFFQFKHLGFDIKWVDDTHALGVFSSRTAAEAALAVKHPFVKTRPLSQSIKESKKKAQKCAEFLQPYKPRPETSALLARRLVAGALGLQLHVSKEQRDEEMRKIREAKDRRRQAIKQKEAAWNGLIDS